MGGIEGLHHVTAIAGEPQVNIDFYAGVLGPTRGLEEIHAIVDRDRLANYPFYFAALGEF